MRKPTQGRNRIIVLIVGTAFPRLPSCGGIATATLAKRLTVVMSKIVESLLLRARAYSIT